MRLSSVPQSLVEGIALAFSWAPTPIIDTFVALLLAKTIMAAVAVNLFDALEAEPLTVNEIAGRIGTDPAATGRLLRALYACKYVRWKNNRYGLAPVSRHWLVSKRPTSLQAAVLHRKIDLRMMDFEAYLRAGRGKGFHEQLGPDDWQLYHQGQASHAALIVEEVVTRAPLPSGATDLLDLGGGHGLYAFCFCNRYPSLRARVLDLAVATGSFESPWTSQVALHRVEFQRGDIRTAELPEQAFDAVLIANVFHHFDEAANRVLVRRAWETLRPGGILIAVDAVRPISINESDQIESLLDFYFGAASGAGLWSIEQIRAWQQQAGFELLSPVTMRLLPCCKMQSGKKAR